MGLKAYLMITDVKRQEYILQVKEILEVIGTT